MNDKPCDCVDGKREYKIDGSTYGFETCYKCNGENVVYTEESAMILMTKALNATYTALN